ncbi:ATP synthase subunit b 3 [Rhodospirillum centenum]|uniref:ATP synthase subunit b 3 n=1 Tax=Rhodospirillum centenum (strain ATCC 51521 / SW) TaxID=414684 RepID=ATPF3_RHOCS|nr:ATP synthase subunit b 3 [Rhodospirillum centenum]B6IX47.1 RecName: Full=ATP synthase subunit b 3; AltName: Full=ATP synthase F(0) sector subunit b 3; AltName: Full=ATPase subunit I 3; AltName: Full=F-type ATPase subunit b 3; Short=F-ATPase subunit b 3 [Rhodospirillum centenum SW]ACJ00871.1 ATP synthase F0, B subunit [Rhodospirillum centenum SW]
MLQNPTFWVLVAFVLFVAAVWRIAANTIGKALDDRAERIREEIEQAQKLREDAQAALAQYQRKQRDALKEAENIIAAAREEADRIRRRAATDLEASLRRREAQAMEKIAQAEAQAVQQVRDLAVDIAVAATERILVQNMDATRDEVLVGNAIAELPAKLH